MKDHNYVDENGNRIPTSQLPTWRIEELLSGPLEIVNDDGHGVCTLEDVRERLKIELLIRSLKL